LGAGKHLVPRTEGRPFALHDDFELAAVAGFAIAGCGVLEQIGGKLRGEDFQPLGIIRRQEPPAQIAQCLPALRGSSSAVDEGILEQAKAFDKLEPDVEAGRPLLAGVLAPGFKDIAPGNDGVDPAADRQPHLRPPAVVDRWQHGGLEKVAVALLAIEECRSDSIMTVAENVRFDDERLDGRAFGMKSATIDFRHHRLDGDALVEQRAYQRFRSATCRGGQSPGTAGPSRLFKHRWLKRPPLACAGHGILPRRFDRVQTGSGSATNRHSP
jgi:hypothetical protein